MDLKGIISISGMSGLYKIVATNKNGFIVESFTDKKKFAVSSTQRVSTLEDITIYTEDGDVPLKEVLKTLDEKAGKDIKPDPKAEPEQLKKDMEVLLPDYDKERVYNSDIKKLFSWYTILKESDFSFEDEPETEVEVEEPKETEKKTGKKTEKTAVKVKKEKVEEEKTPAKKKVKKETPKTDKPTKKEKEKASDKSNPKAKAKTKTASAKATKSKVEKKAAPKKKR